MKSTSELVTEIMATTAPFKARLAEAFDAIRDGEDLHMDEYVDACFYAIEEAADKAPTHKVKVWTVTTDNDSGMGTTVFTSEAECLAYAWEYIGGYYGEDADDQKEFETLQAKHGHDVQEAWNETPHEVMDSFSYDGHEIEVETPAPTPPHMTALVDRLDAGADMDIFYDVDERDDAEGATKIGNTQSAMREAANLLRSMAAPAPIGIILEGGVIQSIFSPTPELCPDYYIIDYDTQGADESELVRVPQSDGSTKAAFVTDDRPQKAESFEWFAALDAAINEAQANG